MKKIIIIVILSMVSLMFFTTTAFAADAESDTDPLGMDAWKEYAEYVGFETYDGNVCDEDALKYFDSEDFSDSWVSGWELEGQYIQIFRYHFSDSDSASSMLLRAEALIKESGRSEIDRVEEEDFTIIKLVLDSEIWYMDLVRYGADFFFIELCDEDGAELLDVMLEKMFASVESAAYYGIAEDAIEVLAEKWNENYWNEDYPDKEYLLDIRSTRIICIKDKDTLEGKAADYFGDVQYVVEFLMYDDYFSYGNISSGQNAGYYQNTGVDNHIVVYTDGSMECKTNFIRVYSSMTYNMDYSVFIDQVIDFHEHFNQRIHFRNHQIVFEDAEDI